ncbi:cellulose binding domain-containing protein [Microbispora hainanensis]|uniref:cellulose binding domain-containing protein n=1 Tax=Microbispora hainanensis TaxID=568844 RepID=UPI0034044FC5
MVNQWGGGFQGEVTVNNTGASSVSAWTVTWTYADGQQITQAWGGKATQSGASVTVKNESWNGSLGAGASTTFGFIASWNSANSAPTPACTTA